VPGAGIGFSYAANAFSAALGLMAGFPLAPPVGNPQTGFEVHALCAGRCRGKASQDPDGVFRLGSDGVVGVDIGGTNYSRLIDYKSRWYRQCPRPVSIELFEIDSETEIDFTQVFRQFENEVELERHPVAGVAQQQEGQMFLFGELAIELFELRGNDYKGSTERGYLGKCFLQS